MVDRAPAADTDTLIYSTLVYSSGGVPTFRSLAFRW